MAKLPIDMNAFNEQIDFSNIEVSEKYSGILAKQFMPVPTSYTGKGFLSINGGNGFRLFTEGTEAQTKNNKKRGNASAIVKKIPCVTLHDIIVVDKKLFKIYNSGIEYDVTEPIIDQNAVLAWGASDNYNSLLDAIRNAIVQNISRVIDYLGFYGVDAYGNAVPGIAGANTTVNAISDTDASKALVEGALLVGNPSLGATSNSFAASLRDSENQKTSNGVKIGFGDIDYDGIIMGRSDTINSNEAFVYSANSFQWGLAGNVEAEVLKEATLDDDTNLALSDQYGLKVDLYIGTAWNLDKVAYIEKKNSSK